MKSNVRALLRAGTVAAAAASMFAVTVTVAGQAPAPAAPTAKPAAPAQSATAKPYVPAKTAWGEPDIQGMFNFSYVGTVQLERCGGGGVGTAPASVREAAQAELARQADLLAREAAANPAPPAAAEPPAAPRAGGPPPGAGGPPPAAGAGGRPGGPPPGAGGGGRGGGRGACDPNVAFRPEEEYLAAVKQAEGRTDRARDLAENGQFGQALQAGVTDPTWPQRQTSLIMDPPDGRLPALTPEGTRRMMLMKSSWAWVTGEPQTWDSYEDFDHWDRCITRGLPASMGPYRYNNGMQILQAPGVVILNLEMIHEARIVYTDGRPSPDTSVIQQYMGESRGRWENGNTLVITTTGIKPGPSMTNIGIAGSPAGNRIPQSDKLTLVEKIRATEKGMIEYEMTVTDPVILTRPWTLRAPLKDDPTYEWWEYACHEGNTAIPNYVNANRAERARFAAAAKLPPAPASAAPAGGGRGGRGGRGQ